MKIMNWSVTETIILHQYILSKNMYDLLFTFGLRFLWQVSFARSAYPAFEEGDTSILFIWTIQGLSDLTKAYHDSLRWMIKHQRHKTIQIISSLLCHTRRFIVPDEPPETDHHTTGIIRPPRSQVSSWGDMLGNHDAWLKNNNFIATKTCNCNFS